MTMTRCDVNDALTALAAQAGCDIDDDDLNEITHVVSDALNVEMRQTTAPDPGSIARSTAAPDSPAAPAPDPNDAPLLVDFWSGRRFEQCALTREEARRLQAILGTWLDSAPRKDGEPQ